MRRVVVTGLGLVSPLGLGVEAVWRRLLRGESGLGTVNAFNSDAIPCRVAGQIPQGHSDDHGLDLDQWFLGTRFHSSGRFSQLALIAAGEAIEDSGWTLTEDEHRLATGVCVGSGCGDLDGLCQATSVAAQPGDGANAPYMRGRLIHQAACDIAERFGLAGPNRTVSTACATGVHAVGDASRMIMFGDADVMIAGGTEAAICELGMAGFCAARALSTNFNDRPTQASRPWDQDRDGFVMGEGAGMLVLEAFEHAKARGANIYAEVAGYGMSGDAYHITAPAEGHDGAYRAMKNAIRNSGIALDQIQYVNAHGTSTPLGDDLELEAVENVFGDHAGSLAMSSTKSATGHLLGAAGAVEAIFSILSIRDGAVPPTLNLDRPSRQSAIDRVAHVAQSRKVHAALSNSFGFGGTNASLLFRAV
jgi:3-oxoacyl-[acyl-carrier-protein] synthase II